MKRPFFNTAFSHDPARRRCNRFGPKQNRGNNQRCFSSEFDLFILFFPLAIYRRFIFFLHLPTDPASFNSRFLTIVSFCRGPDAAKDVYSFYAEVVSVGQKSPELHVQLVAALWCGWLVFRIYPILGGKKSVLVFTNLCWETGNDGVLISFVYKWIYESEIGDVLHYWHTRRAFFGSWDAAPFSVIIFLSTSNKIIIVSSWDYWCPILNKHFRKNGNHFLGNCFHKCY